MQNIVPKICKNITGNFYTLYFKGPYVFRDSNPCLYRQGGVTCFINLCRFQSIDVSVRGYLLSSNSRISPGWHSNARHIASSVEKRTALALPVLRIERLTIDISTFSANSESDILRRASITSKFTIIAISRYYIVIDSSSFILAAMAITSAKINKSNGASNVSGLISI